MFLSFRWAPLLFALAAAPACADRIALKNGDRLTGAIVKSDAKELVFQSDLAGEVRIAWEAVTEVKAGLVHVGLQGGRKLSGELTLAEGAAEIRTAEGGVVRAARSEVEYIRCPAEQAAFERYVSPGLTDLWAGFVDLGLSVTRGNAVTSNLAAGAQAVRKTNRDKIDVHFTSVYASNRTAGVSVVTAHAVRGGVSYNLNLSPAAFVFGSTDLEYDEFQGLDLRLAPAGGFGWHVWKSDRGRFDLNGGASLNREFFTGGVTRTSGEALLGQEAFYKLNSRVSVSEKLAFFPNLTDRGVFRVNFDASLATALWKWLGWQFTVSDRMLSDPLPGRKKNDLLLTTGIRLTFAR